MRTPARFSDRRWMAAGLALLAVGSLLLSTGCARETYSTPTPESPEKAARAR